MGVEHNMLISPLDHLPADLRYVLWAQYLRLSPSYELARAFRAHEVTLDQLPHDLTDFDKVLAVYDDFGDVWAQPIEQWWDQKFVYLFVAPRSELNMKLLTVMQQGELVNLDDMTELLKVYFDRTRPDMGNPLTMLISVPLDGDRRELIRTFGEMLTFHKANRRDKAPTLSNKAKYQLTKQKITLESLASDRDTVLFRSAHTDMTLWQIGADLDLSPTYAEMVRGERKATVDLLHARNALGVAAKHSLDNALTLAENAARGKFPANKSAVTHAKDFDFDLIQSRAQREYEARFGTGVFDPTVMDDAFSTPH